MALVSPAQVTDGSSIDAADVNTPINQLATEINGNLDANNLATNAVSTAKIQDASITNAKLSTTAGELGGAWTTWSPSYSAITVGDGTVVARYMQIGKTVFAQWRLVCGSTTTITNVNTISLPVTAASRYGAANGQSVGTVAVLDDSTSTRYAGWAIILTTTTVGARWTAAGTEPAINTGFPITEATGDIFDYNFTYEAA